jgi:hypothetical protein
MAKPAFSILIMRFILINEKLRGRSMRIMCIGGNDCGIDSVSYWTDDDVFGRAEKFEPGDGGGRF